ncbi:hypothetical protein COU54_03290 [Candidatus Pacearchaeota archaeon CG10_big_fil_rev_8_21_14_0_10_31_24]|nr:MAG: hypothetical protein COU54_03290 [Candidatus Pacearchaeota archaeon CG10_big_fil_rev_8_21_14_0_10_31_24]
MSELTDLQAYESLYHDLTDRYTRLGVMDEQFEDRYIQVGPSNSIDTFIKMVKTINLELKGELFDYSFGRLVEMERELNEYV